MLTEDNPEMFEGITTVMRWTNLARTMFTLDWTHPNGNRIRSYMQTSLANRWRDVAVKRYRLDDLLERG